MNPGKITADYLNPTHAVGVEGRKQPERYQNVTSRGVLALKGSRSQFFQRCETE